MSKTIKNNLFRFVTLRNPQLIDKKEEKPGFVFHPDEDSGAFFQAIRGIALEDIPVKLKSTSESFSALKTRIEARQINEKLYLFSSWLMRNKNTLTFAEINNNSDGVTTLDLNQLLLVWDNLIYQTIEKKSSYVREAMIQLLVANQFLDEFIRFSEGLSDDITFTEDQEKEFIRRANASVVMSKLLFSNTKTPQNQDPKVTPQQEKRILDTTDVVMAKERIKRKSKLFDELKRLQTGYNKSIQKAYDKDLKVHNALVEDLLDNAVPKLVDVVDPNTGEITRTTTYPDLDIPKFEFIATEAITKSYMDGRLSDASLSEFISNELEMYDDFPETLDAIKKSIDKDYKLVFNKTPKTSKKVKVGGAILRASNSSISDYDYNISPLSYVYPSGEREVFMLFFNYVQESPIQSIDYTIIFDNGTEINDTEFDIISSSNETTFVKLFPSLIPFPSGTQTYTLKGQVTLEDGRILSFERLVDLKSRLNLGMFDLVTDLEVPVETVEKPKLYGVTNLGIADFRRVEQEVCCYVPGEVSHIENVMAREYKERSTRNLVSSEVTTEKTDERERENLTDTTTTERNEMQTEVASVLNSDQSQSQGGSASVSGGGKMFKFSADAHFDTSSSSSTSNSNTQAQTYAQEVTERAMERIVQKTQTKRTSRILKEFEENNKHGFDNTKGTEHVSGVYRWVDKIYKNTLINYGKRLMYEFAIPEPSRFFKEAIWRELENDQLESGIILPEAPTHPSLLDEPINSADDLNESNYQIVASEYNADVVPAPAYFTKFSKPYKFDFIQNKSNEEGSSIDKIIEIPEGYETTNVKVNGSFFYEGGNNNKKINIAIGSTSFTGFNSNSDTFETDQVSLTGYERELAVTASTYDVLTASFNVTVDCIRTDKAFEAWKDETYKAIMDAYNDRLQEYNDAQNQDVIPFTDKEKILFNPLHNRSLEKKELKRIAIELITKPFEVETAKDNYFSGPNPRVKRDQAFQDHASTVKFFEQAFDWDIMAYIFYPYFYGKETNWEELFQAQDAADPLFQAFLQSGMARTVVPVRPGFEDAVNWYMETGEIWNGQGLVVDQDDDLYVSVAEEMQTIEGVVEGTWETRLPTSLTVIQAGSIGLNVEGLPCNEECRQVLFESDRNPIEPSNNIIGGEEGVGSDAVSGVITVE
ncbi:hypothetical protein [uncultured Psychroserpens sp.]|uniref:hypothetical protein n=1 Tax=uncultured Psychroserpens sp. TaxID=255436 RepID=UPI00262F7A24|nr:hypothetical protein [uncultured Psychroserpens sp.]